jgi:hypothetical protein
MSENRSGIGQHRGDGSAAPNSGQRTRRDPDAVVGPNLSGGEMQNAVPGSKPINSGVPIHGAEDAPFYDRNVRRKGGK